MPANTSTQLDPVRERAVQATAWFSTLVHALLVKPDVQAAAEADTALQTLGVSVRFGRRQRRARAAPRTHTTKAGQR